MADTLAGKRILVVDDQFVNRIIVKEMLKKYEVDITEAGDGEEAVSTVEENVPFDLILMDVMMPDVDGYEATKRIRAIADSAKANVPIIAMTGDVSDEDITTALKSGMNDHIAKPVDSDILTEKIYTYING